MTNNMVKATHKTLKLHFKFVLYLIIIFLFPSKLLLASTSDGLITYWDFEGVSGSSIIDKSNNLNNGSVIRKC